MSVVVTDQRGGYQPWAGLFLMAIHEIIDCFDARLRRLAKKVDVIGAEVDALVNDMQSTMYANEGIGLAAPQIGEDLRVIVLDLSAGRERGHFLAFINPEITEWEGEMVRDEEGCLSLPGVREEVSRKERVKLRAFNREGEMVKLEADGMLARVIQHEVDHLDGKLFIDYLPFWKRLLILWRMRRKKSSPA